LIVDFAAFLAVKATYCCQYFLIFLLAKLAHPLNFKIFGIYPSLPLMVFPFEAVEVREILWRDRANQSGSTPGKPAGKANRREGGGQSNNLSSKRSLFSFKPDKVKNCNLQFFCALKRFNLLGMAQNTQHCRYESLVLVYYC